MVLMLLVLLAYSPLVLPLVVLYTFIIDFIFYYNLVVNVLHSKVLGTLYTSKWAKYIDKEIIVKPLLLYKSRGVFTQQINFF